MTFTSTVTALALAQDTPHAAVSMAAANAGADADMVAQARHMDLDDAMGMLGQAIAGPEAMRQLIIRALWIKLAWMTIMMIVIYYPTLACKSGCCNNRRSLKGFLGPIITASVGIVGFAICMFIAVMCVPDTLTAGWVLSGELSSAIMWEAIATWGFHVMFWAAAITTWAMFCCGQKHDDGDEDMYARKPIYNAQPVLPMAQPAYAAPVQQAPVY